MGGLLRLGAGVLGGIEKGRKRFFLKKEAKTFASGVRVAAAQRLRCKSFLVLFFKKELLPFRLRPTAA
jgi:hypothetical protein